MSVRDVDVFVTNVEEVTGSFVVTSGDDATDKFTKANHGLRPNAVVSFSATGTMPGGVTADTQYYVIVTPGDKNTFQIKAAKDGSAVDITSYTSVGVLTATFSYMRGAPSVSVNLGDHSIKQICSLQVSEYTVYHKETPDHYYILDVGGINGDLVSNNANAASRFMVLFAGSVEPNAVHHHEYTNGLRKHIFTPPTTTNRNLTLQFLRKNGEKAGTGKVDLNDLHDSSTEITYEDLGHIHLWLKLRVVHG
tara:strand:- start:1002 stop:1751 length:750 start_codon:yes stop_codon:yes gene_type:complete